MISTIYPQADERSALLRIVNHDREVDPHLNSGRQRRSARPVATASA
jgi:hypothetical protein